MSSWETPREVGLVTFSRVHSFANNLQPAGFPSGPFTSVTWAKLPLVPTPSPTYSSFRTLTPMLP